MEKAYLYLSLMIIFILLSIFIASAILQTEIALIAVILFTLLLLLFYFRRKSEKMEMIAMWITLILFIITAAIMFIPGGF